MHIGINGSNKVEVGEAGNHPGFCIGPTVLNREIYYSILVYRALEGLCSQSDKARKETIDHYVSYLPELLKEIIKDPSSESSTIVRFCHPIIEKFSVLARNYDIKNFQLENLKEKLWFLKKLKSKNSFAAMQKAYRDKWGFYSLMNDVDFKQTYVNKAVGELDEPVGKSFREGINKYVKLVEEGREISSKYFGKASFQAYCEETGNADKTLNINLINYSGNESIKISDILQQEESIDKLNIYYNKRHDICAHREDQKRYYKFKEGAWYQMISEWPIKDKSGRGISRCTMVMNVGSDGIAEIVEFIGKGSNGENHILSLEQDMELIKQNKELYIQNVLLCDAVEEFLRMQRSKDNSSPGAVPQNTDSNGVSEVCGEQLKPSHGDNVGGTANSSGESIVPTEVNLQDKETQTETDLQQQKIDELVQINHKLCKELVELGRLMQNSKGVEGDVRKCGLQDSEALKRKAGEMRRDDSHVGGKMRRLAER